ncbi:hypothetical protein Peur_063777 [Populus x canadensis]
MTLKELNEKLYEVKISCTIIIGHNAQEHFVILVRGRKVKDLPTVRYHIIQGTLDVIGAKDCQQGCSRFLSKSCII